MIAQKAPNSIQTICEKLSHLHGPLSSESIGVLLTQLAAHPDELTSFERFDKVGYSRNRIYSNEFVDLLLLCWKPAQRTPVHNHAGSTCGVYIIRGEATEVSFQPSGVGLLVPESCKRLSPGEVTISVDSDAHLVGNFASTTQDLVTLHCYSPPLVSMQIFGESETFLADYSAMSARAATSGCYHIDL